MTTLRPDQIHMVPLDEFVSASGLWKCVLASRFEAKLNGATAYYMVVFYAGTNRVRKIVRFSIGDEMLAFSKWQDWKNVFQFAPPGAVYEEDTPDALSVMTFSPPFLTEEEKLLKLRPRGARIFVRDVTPVDEITKRAEAVGLVAVVSEEHKPRPTLGIVVALGEDPLVAELYKLGDIIMFSKHAGQTFNEAGQTYRILELQEIVGIRDAADGVEDLMPSKDAHLG